MYKTLKHEAYEPMEIAGRTYMTINVAAYSDYATGGVGIPDPQTREVQ